MEHEAFMELKLEDRVEVAMDLGEYLGEDEQDRSVYQMPAGYWVRIQEAPWGRYGAADALMVKPANLRF